MTSARARELAVGVVLACSCVGRSFALPVACCLPDGGCAELEHNDCADALGDPHEAGSACTGVSCAAVIVSSPPVFSPVSPMPECFQGFCETSVHASPQIVATDVTLAEDQTIHRVRWWGAYVGWVGTDAPPVAPLAYQIGLWSHAPAGSGSPATPFARPDTLLDSWVVTRAELDETRAGCAMSPELEFLAGDAFSYSFAIPESVRPTLPAGTTRWFSIAAMYVVDGCECSADVVAPFGTPNASDVTAVNGHVGCPVGSGDPLCDASDVNCDGVVSTRDAQIAQCQVNHGWTNPECCVPSMEFPWSIITSPLVGSGAIVMFSPTAPNLGSAYVSGEPLGDAFSMPWDVAMTLYGEESTTVPPSAPLPEQGGVAKNRYFSFEVPPSWSGFEIAVRARLATLDRFPSFNGEYRWAGTVLPYQVSSGSPQTFLAAAMGCAPVFQTFDAGEIVHLYGAEAVPLSSYELQAVERGCETQLENPACYSPSVAVATAKWGDVAAPFGGGSQPNFADIAAVVDTFRGQGGSLPKMRVQLQPNVVDPAANVNFLDISATTSAFRGLPYLFTGPLACP